MSASPLRGKQVHSTPWNTNSPFIPLHCFNSTSYTILPSIFHITNSSFLLQPAQRLVKRVRLWAKRVTIKRPQPINTLWSPAEGNRCRIAVRAQGETVGEESLIELQNTLITTVSHIPALNGLRTIWATKGKKKKKLHLIQCPERSCKAIIIKHPCICVQTISQLLPLILYMQKGTDWPQSLVSPPDHDPFI